MAGIQTERTRQILADPRFTALAAERARLRWGLSLTTLAMFFGFIALVSAAPARLGATLPGSLVPVGMLLALAVILLVVAITGFYVHRSNSHLDHLVEAVRQGVRP